MQDSKEMLGEKAKWQLHTNAVSCLEQILEASPNETAAVRPLTSHFANNPRKLSKTCWALVEKQELTHKRRSQMDSDTWTL